MHYVKCIMFLMHLSSITEMLTTQADRFSAEEVRHMFYDAWWLPWIQYQDHWLRVVSDGADVQRVPSRRCRKPGLLQSGPHHHSRRGEGPGIVHSLLSQSQRSLCVCTRPLVYDWQAWKICSYWNKNVLIFFTYDDVVLMFAPLAWNLSDFTHKK